MSQHQTEIIVFGDGVKFMSDQTEDVAVDYADILLERAAKFQAILERAGNAPVAEAAILGRLIRLLLPGAGEDLFRAADDEIREHVGLNEPTVAERFKRD